MKLLHDTLISKRRKRQTMSYSQLRANHHTLVIAHWRGAWFCLLLSLCCLGLASQVGCADFTIDYVTRHGIAVYHWGSAQYYYTKDDVELVTDAWLGQAARFAPENLGYTGFYTFDGLELFFAGPNKTQQLCKYDGIGDPNIGGCWWVRDPGSGGRVVVETYSPCLAGDATKKRDGVKLVHEFTHALEQRTHSNKQLWDEFGDLTLEQQASLKVLGQQQACEGK